MFGQFGPTPYDLQFSIFGIPVRVHPVFWLTSALIVWNVSQGDPAALVVLVLCVFVSILVHELGHALMTRRFGWQPEIVLVFFGGYATTTHHSTWRNIAVLIAGPAAGFLLLGAVIAFAVARAVYGFLPYDLASHAIFFLIWANLMWNVINLVPVMPLDGGQICRELCLWFSPRYGADTALKISIVASGSVAAFAVMLQMDMLPTVRALLGLNPLFLAFIFGYLCFMGIQEYQNRGRGYR